MNAGRGDHGISSNGRGIHFHIIARFENLLLWTIGYGECYYVLDWRKSTHSVTFRRQAALQRPYGLVPDLRVPRGLDGWLTAFCWGWLHAHKIDEMLHSLALCWPACLLILLPGCELCLIMVYAIKEDSPTGVSISSVYRQIILAIYSTHCPPPLSLPPPFLFFLFLDRQ